jgi:hypothetical protein
MRLGSFVFTLTETLGYKVAKIIGISDAGVLDGFA